MKPRGAPLSALTLLSLCEEAGYRREEAKGLSRYYIMEVIQHDRDHENRLVPQHSGRAVKPVSPEERLRKLLRSRKCPEHLIDQKVRSQAQQGPAGKKKPSKKR